MADSAALREGFNGMRPDPGKAIPNDRHERAPSHAGDHTQSAAWHPKQGRAAIHEPSFVTHRQRTASVGDGTHLHNLPQQAPAYPPCTAKRRGAGLADPAHAGSAASRGAKPRAAGIARRAFPWRQAQCAAPQVRRREGLKPNGRDGKDGTGRSPESPAALCADTLGQFSPDAIAASFATVFKLRAVPADAAGSLSFDCPMPDG